MGVLDVDLIKHSLLILIILSSLTLSGCLDSERKSNLHTKGNESEKINISEKALEIALNDSEVKKIIGTNYRILNVTMSHLERIYKGVRISKDYPVVVVDTKSSINYIYVDIENETVVNIGTVYKRQPLPPEKPAPLLTPPPLVMTPIHPGKIVMDFIKFYNERNATELYEMFSDRIKMNRSIEDTEKELSFAENHNISLAPNEKLFARDGLMENETMIYKANLTISYSNGAKNATIEFPILYVKYTREKDNLTYIGFQPAIDGWVFEEIREVILENFEE
ncbi:hypothetical protein [Geoglobus acetivorans]